MFKKLFTLLKSLLETNWKLKKKQPEKLKTGQHIDYKNYSYLWVWLKKVIIILLNFLEQLVTVLADIHACLFCFCKQVKKK